MNYFFKIEVRGRGRFPLDQLRRFEMFPIDIETAQQIEISIEESLHTGTYTLGMYAKTLSADSPCIARFASFGFIANSLEIWRDVKLLYKNGEAFHDLEPATERALFGDQSG